MIMQLLTTLGSVAKLAYATDLKSVASGLEGSSPSAPTSSNFEPVKHLFYRLLIFRAVWFVSTSQRPRS